MHDVVFRDARVIDGSGGAPFAADVAIDGDRIVHVGPNAKRSRVDIDAAGAVLAPGFVDVHTHDDRLVLADPAVTPKVSQGVTTVVTGNCGISLAPYPRAIDPPPPMTLLSTKRGQFHVRFADYAAALRAAPPAVNVAAFVGHSTLRAATMEDLSRPASRMERAAMADLVSEAMEAGAFGVTTGLYYPPAQAAPPEEVAQVLKRAAEAGGLYTTHMRDEGEAIVSSVEETVWTAREAGSAVVISHLKCASPGVWGRAAKVLAAIDAAAASGQEIAFDVYPYAASSTMLRADRIEGAKKVVVAWSEPYPEQSGRDLADVAADWCCSPEQAADRLAPGGAIYHRMVERDVKKILAHPRAMIGSDGLPHDVHPHPRLWGTFPRVLGHYVRKLKVLELPEAIRRMTSLPAQVFGLKDRGLVAEGKIADLTLFNADTVLDRATYDAPTRLSRGVAAVMVAGRFVWRDDAATGERPGVMLRRAA